jgi:hypothetical protein
MSYFIPEFTASIVDSGFSPEDDNTRELYNEVAAFAKQGQPIVIFGPSGAGKEFLARHYYNTFINAEFYQQYMENWPSKFNEIKKQYSACYSGQSLDIFLNSIKAGIFQSINSATIYPNLAESILFGHEANSFTGALTKPGLLESVKFGVLFLDEIGELPKNIQAKLLRAVDSEIAEGCRISGKMNYPLKDIIIISATNQPRDMIRDDFYYKMGIEVNINELDERPKDVRKAIPYFIIKAIGKRKDYAAIINMFGIKGIKKVNKLQETAEVRNFAQYQSNLITSEILKRKWPGNFRALRIALEASILRVELTDDPESFSEEFRNYLQYYIAKYSVAAEKTSVSVEKPSPASVYPSLYPDLDRRIQNKIENEDTFRDINDQEKNVLAVFLSSTHKKGFRRRDLEDYYKKHNTIKYTSEAHIRNRINKLLALNILNKTGSSKSTRYQLTKHFLDSLNLKNAGIFSLPVTRETWIGRYNEIDALSRVLHNTGRVYIQAPPRFGKSAFITMFCKARENEYNFYYYSLGEAGIKKLFDILLRLQTDNAFLVETGLRDNPIHRIHPFLSKLFRNNKKNKPVLILDNAHYVSDPDGLKTIADLAKKWQEVLMILIGDTMDNALLDDFHEFPLGPWGQEA